LRSVLRDRPQLRRYLVRCRHCGIFFIADPRNAERDDLGCPFGCAALHRRRRSKERSVRYNGSPVGKAKRHQRNEERRRAGSMPSTLEGLEGSAAAPREAGHGSVASSAGPLPRDLEVDDASSRPEALPAVTSGAVGSGPAEPERVEFASRMVDYIRAVVSLIEARRVSVAEVIEMLERTKRQHSLAREKRGDYVVRWLREHHEKPP
jgi:hypothetical protein